MVETAAAAACCHARSGRAVGQDGRERPAAGRGGASISYVTGRVRSGGLRTGFGRKFARSGNGRRTLGWSNQIALAFRNKGVDHPRGSKRMSARLRHHPGCGTALGQGACRSRNAGRAGRTGRTMRPPTVYGAHQPGIVTPHLRHAVLTAYDLDGHDPREVLRGVDRRGGAAHARRARHGHDRARRRRARRAPVSSRFPRSTATRWTRHCAVATWPCSSRPTTVRPSALAGAEAALAAARHPYRPRRARLPRRHAEPPAPARLRPPRVGERRTIAPGWSAGPISSSAASRSLPAWHALPEPEQEQIIGRDKRTGAPSRRPPLRPADPRPAPARRPHPCRRPVRHASTLLRRGYDTDDGLLFLAFMADPRRQFITAPCSVSRAHDALHRHTRHVGSAFFADPTRSQPRVVHRATTLLIFRTCRSQSPISPTPAAPGPGRPLLPSPR